jgi:hypothetical protein
MGSEPNRLWFSAPTFSSGFLQRFFGEAVTTSLENAAV